MQLESFKTLCGFKWIIPRKCRRFVTGVFSLCVILAAQSSSQSEWEIHTVLPESSQNFKCRSIKKLLSWTYLLFWECRAGGCGWLITSDGSINYASFTQTTSNPFFSKLKIIERMACSVYGRDGLTCFPCRKKSERNPRSIKGSIHRR